MLAAHLPPGASIHAVTGSDNAWSDTEWMLRHVAYLLELANWQRGGAKGTKPNPLDTPSQSHARATAAERKRARAEQAKQRHINRMKARREQA